MIINVIKAHGSQNTFFVIDIRNQSFFSNDVLKKITISLCNPQGLLKGADGVLYIDKGIHSKYKMRIFNADGSEALMCGNGMRIVARWALEESKTSTNIVENITNLVYSVSSNQDFHSDVKGVSIKFPSASLDASQVLLSTEPNFLNKSIPTLHPDLLFTAVAMPNPHIVANVQKIDMDLLALLGKKANEITDIFPAGVNLSFMQQLNANELYVATYERGVGLTNACGTAMIASTLVAILQNKVQRNQLITVKNPGGYVQISIDEQNAATMIGNATYLLEAQIEIDEDEIDVYTIQEFTINQKEIDAYNKLLKEIEKN